MPGTEVADAAIGDVSETHKKASIELQRRLIEALWRYNEQAARATKVLIVLTVVLTVLTAVLVLLAIFD